jgi:hypothetical protein
MYPEKKRNMFCWHDKLYQMKQWNKLGKKK